MVHQVCCQHDTSITCTSTQTGLRGISQAAQIGSSPVARSPDGVEHNGKRVQQNIQLHVTRERMGSSFIC
jgi:hypothetical protein